MIIQLHGQFETANYGDLLLGILFAKHLHSLGHTIIIKNACDELYENLDFEVLKNGKPDRMICCGGGYLSDGNTHFSLHMMKRIFLEMGKCRIKKIPFIIVGAGSKPFVNKLTKPLMAWCINGADSLYVRNNETKKDLLDLGIKRKIIVTADNVMAIDEQVLNKKNLEKNRNYINSFFKEKKKLVLLHLNYLALDGNQKIIDGGNLLEEAIAKYANRCDEYNYIVAYDHKIAAFENQCDSLMKKLPQNRALLMQGDSVDTVLSLIYLSDIIITTKLHVGITGVALKKNVLSFPMHIKAKRFFKQLNDEDRCMLLQECVDIDKVIKQFEKYMNTNIAEADVVRVKNNAKKNYEVIEKFCEDLN
jgi:polysaccharide pyruvyl transferase WcaK-like protein